MACKTHTLTLKRLQELLSYDPETGIFTRRDSGERAGGIRKDGYETISIDNVRHLAHRLAVFYVTGCYPEKVDHRDTVRFHNWFSNLRPATTAQNGWNSKARIGSSGFKGVSASGNRFKAEISANGERRYIGSFSTAELAASAYDAAAVTLHGDFAQVNFR